VIAVTDKPKDPSKLYISASQIETFSLCKRKWWFDKVKKLPKPNKGYFAFGTCLHGCLERWILSTENGRVPDEGEWDRVIHEEFAKGKRKIEWGTGPFKEQIIGQPTELFPKGFEIVEDTDDDGTVKGRVVLTPNEVKQIKKLVAQAIERGIVTKGENIYVEHGFELDLIDNVVIVGYLDFLRIAELPEIHDHKSFSKSSERYLKQPGPRRANGNFIAIVEPQQDGDGTSPNCVGHVQQNLTYAWAYSEVADYKGPVLVRHNQFPKFEDLKGVRSVEALVSHKRIKVHGDHLRQVAKEMVKVSKIKKWEDTPPPSTVTACSDFGGCDFQGICGRRVNVEVYSQRTVEHNAQAVNETRPNFPTEKKRTKGNANMASNVFKRKSAGDEPKAEVPSTMPKKGAFARKKAEEAEPEEEAEAEEEAPKKSAKFNGGKKPAEDESVENGAPWGDPNCPACKGLGMNTKGNACPICDKTAKKRGVPSSIMYEIEVTDEGYVAKARKEHAEAIGEMDAPNKWTFERDAPAEPAPKASKFGKAKAKPDEDEEPSDDDEAQEPAPKKSSAFSRKGKAPAQTEEEAQEEEEAEEEAPPAKGKFARRGAAPAEPEEEPEAEEPQDDSDEAAAPRRGRGRPPGSKNRSTLQREAEGSVGGRPRAGITLVKGASIVHGPDRPSMMAQSLLETLGAEMASDMGTDSFFELDQRKRQDRLKQAGKEIADTLGRTVVIFPAGTMDFDLVALFNALAPHAEWVVEGTR